MYDSFRKMIDDLYNNPDFVQYCYVNGFKYKCFVSSMQSDMYFTEAGLQDTTNFYLDLQLSEQSGVIPQQNDKVMFREKYYKVAHTVVDSALATVRLYLVALSRGK